jgi:hypothetical protein
LPVVILKLIPFSKIVDVIVTLGFSVYPTRPDADILSQLKLELNIGGSERRLIVAEVVKGIRPEEIRLRSGIMELRLQ